MSTRKLSLVTLTSRLVVCCRQVPNMKLRSEPETGGIEHAGASLESVSSEVQGISDAGRDGDPKAGVSGLMAEKGRLVVQERGQKRRTNTWAGEGLQNSEQRGSSLGLSTRK